MEVHVEQSSCILPISVSTIRRWVILALTFRKETAIPIHQMSTQVPAISKIIVPLDQLNTVSSRQAQFIGTSCREIICMELVSNVPSMTNIEGFQPDDPARSHSIAYNAAIQSATYGLRSEFGLALAGHWTRSPFWMPCCPRC